jgi:hypothetical protein
MNVHKNARLAPLGRAVMISRIETEGWPVARAAAASGVSRRTAYRWLARWRAEGEAGLVDRSSRPHACPHALPAPVIERIERLRRNARPGNRRGFGRLRLGPTARNAKRRHRRLGVGGGGSSGVGARLLTDPS